MKNLAIFKKLVRHKKRLNGLSFSRKALYVGQVVFRELFQRRSTTLFGPRLVEMTLTHRCQCKCVHCYDNHSAAPSVLEEMTRSEVIGTLQQAADLGCIEVCFTGGEPLLRQELLEFIRCARELQMVPKINTNGILLSREAVRDLKEAGLAWCSVSIDSSMPEKHDEFRRYLGCYAKAVEGLRELSRQNVPASITTVARRELIFGDELQKIVDLGHELGAETVRILFPVPMGGLRDQQKEVLSLEERELVRRFLVDPIVTMESPFERCRCGAAVTKMNISPDGSVTPCVFVPLPYGNIRNEPLRQIWKRMAEFDSSCKVAGKCPMCDPETRANLLRRSAQETHRYAVRGRKSAQAF